MSGAATGSCVAPGAKDDSRRPDPNRQAGRVRRAVPACRNHSRGPRQAIEQGFPVQCRWIAFTSHPQNIEGGEPAEGAQDRSEALERGLASRPLRSGCSRLVYSRRGPRAILPGLPIAGAAPSNGMASCSGSMAARLEPLGGRRRRYLRTSLPGRPPFRMLLALSPVLL